MAESAPVSQLVTRNRHNQRVQAPTRESTRYSYIEPCHHGLPIDHVGRPQRYPDWSC